MITTEQLDNFTFEGKKLRAASQGLYEEMNFLIHGLASEVVGDDVFIYKIERSKSNDITFQRILGWVNEKAVSYKGEPVESGRFARNSEGKPYFIVSEERILTRVVR